MSKNTEMENIDKQAPEGAENLTEQENDHIADDTAELAEETGVLLQQIEKLQQEVKDHQDRLLRTVADMDNLRRRTAREKEEIRKLGTGTLMEDLLPALDNLQIGLTAAGKHPEAGEVCKGFEVVANQLSQILEGHGLQRIDPEVGEAFDPNRHEAVAHQPSEEVPDDSILSVMRVGYALNERLLRPASVVVSSGTPEGGN